MSSLFSQLVEAKLAERAGRKLQQMLGAVTNSMEFGRVYALPRRTLDLENVQDVTPLFLKEGGTLSFWPIQSAMLIEAAKADGLFANVGVGWGKTLSTLALPEAMDSKCAVLLVPSQLKRKTLREMENFYGKHFNLPTDRLTVVAYSELSSAKHADILEKLSPDLIICDEAEALKRKSSARTKRFLRYMKEHPECRLAVLSGTLANRSIQEFAHLIELALRKNSPLPKGYQELNDWSGALDVDPDYIMTPGVLKKFCKEGESARDGFRRRLGDTEGVVLTEKTSIGTSLVIRRVSAPVPEKIRALMASVRKNWRLEDEEFDTAMALSRVLRQLACGFYYRWVWSGDEPDFEWLRARREWHREIREKLKQSLEGLDSPLLLARAAERHRLGKKTDAPTWNSETWAEWCIHKDKKPPPTKAVWLDDFLVDASIEWGRFYEKSTTPGIIWNGFRAIGERIAEKGGFPYFGEGTDASESTSPVIVCSVTCQSIGKNLQHYSKNLFTTLAPNGKSFEQVVGRTHRPGQLADEVTIDWFCHTPELENAMAQVIEDASFVQSSLGQRQKVLCGRHI